jgi:hypothetical protein
MLEISGEVDVVGILVGQMESPSGEQEVCALATDHGVDVLKSHAGLAGSGYRVDKGVGVRLALVPRPGTTSRYASAIGA